jgi:hypothetical protein
VPRRKRLLKKAPGAPKRGKTAYILFTEYKRPEVSIMRSRLLLGEYRQ